MTLRPTPRIATNRLVARRSGVRQLAVRAVAGVGVVLLGVGLAGCSGGSTPKPSSSASASASTESAAITDVKTPAGGSGTYVGAQSDVTVTSCKRSGSDWSVAGTVKNPATSTQGYRIYVSLLKGQSDTRAVKEVDVASVGASASKDWSTTIGTDEQGLTCVLRVERFAD
jgi:hypothetical protein